MVVRYLERLVRYRKTGKYPLVLTMPQQWDVRWQPFFRVTAYSLSLGEDQKVMDGQSAMDLRNDG